MLHGVSHLHHHHMQASGTLIVIPNLVWPAWAQELACFWGKQTNCSAYNFHKVVGTLSVMLSVELPSPFLSWIFTILLHQQLFCFLRIFSLFSSLRRQSWRSLQPYPLPQLNYCCSQILLTWTGSHSPRDTHFSTNCKWVDADHVFSWRSTMQICSHTTWCQSPKRKHSIKQSIAQVGLSAVI